MRVMTFLKIIFVIMICMPVAYVLLRLTVDLIDRFSWYVSNSGRSGSGSVRTGSGRSGKPGSRNASSRGAARKSSARSSAGKYRNRRYTKRSGTYREDGRYSAPGGSGYRGYDNGGGRGGRR